MRTWSEYYDVAEHEHARMFAHKHYGLIAAVRTWKLWLPAILLTLAGLGVWWTTQQIAGWWPSADPQTTPQTGGLPTWVAVASAVLLVLTVVAFRPGRGVDRASVLILKGLLIGSAWLALAGFTISFWIT